jgi:hypothetical protein
MNKLQSNTGYFLSEGKEHLRECLTASFARAVHSGVRFIVIFTVNGEGVELACNEFLRDSQFHHLKLVAVSYPFGTVPSAALDIPDSRMKLFQEFHIPLLRATSPIDDIPAPNSRQSNIVRKTLEIFSGGMALCVWGILAACDGGAVPWGEHVIGCCADTSILAKATPSAQLLVSFAIREIVCKPLIHDLSKGESLAQELNVESLGKRRRKNIVTGQKQLPPADVHDAVPKKGK